MLIDNDDDDDDDWSESESECKCLTCNQKPTESQFSLLHEPVAYLEGEGPRGPRPPQSPIAQEIFALFK